MLQGMARKAVIWVVGLGFQGYMALGATVVHYTFDDGFDGQTANTIIDAGPHGLNGTVTGDLTYTSDAPEHGGPIALNATPDIDFVTVPNDPLLHVSGNFTIEAFVKPRFDGEFPIFGSPVHVFINKLRVGGGGSYLSAYYLSYDYQANSFKGGISFGSTGEVVQSGGGFGDEQWYHVAMTYEENAGNSVLTLYIDGVQADQSSSTSQPISYGTHPLYIGAGNFATSSGTGSWRRNFVGLIDEVRISDEALSLQEFLNAGDVTPPTISECVPDQVIDADANGDADIPDLVGSVTATDDQDSSVDISQDPTVGTTVSAGDHIVLFTAEDDNGNTATCSATVTVRDVTPPTISQCAAGQALSAGSAGTAAIPNLTGEIVAGDTVDPALDITQIPVAGTNVGVGQSIIVFTATDDAGNFTTCTAAIAVSDDTPPVIGACVGNQTLFVDETGLTAIPDLTGAVDASDNVDADLDIIQNPAPNQIVGVGHFQLSFTVTDDDGHSATCTASVSVEDDIAPTIATCAPDQEISAGPDDTALIPDLTTLVSATDNVDTQLLFTQFPGGGTATSVDTVVILAVTDDFANSATCTVTLTINPWSGNGPSLWNTDNGTDIYHNDGNVSIGTIESHEKLTVDGKILAEEVIVELSETWPDYVFGADYDMPSLDKLNEHIQQTNHLPDIPPACEIENKGLPVSDMLVRHMRKIEELTLYIIKQHERINHLNQRIEALEKTNIPYGN